MSHSARATKSATSRPARRSCFWRPAPFTWRAEFTRDTGFSSAVPFSVTAPARFTQEDKPHDKQAHECEDVSRRARGTALGRPLLLPPEPHQPDSASHQCVLL